MKKLTTFLLRISLISTFILLSQTAWSARYSSSAVNQLNNGQTVNPGTTGHQVLRVDLVGTGNNAGQSWDLNSIQFALTNNSNYSSAKLYYRSNNSNFGGATLISTINNPGASITFSTFSTTPTASGGSASTLYLWLVVDIKSSITCNGNSIDASVPSNGIDIGGNGGGTKTPTTNNPTGNGNISSSVTPSVSIAASSTSFCDGSSITFTATPTNGGSTPSYQWKVNGNNAGTNSATFASTTLQNNDAVTCVLTSNNVCASPTSATSNSISVSVSITPTSSINPSATQNICGSSGSVLLTANSDQVSGIDYQWKKDGTNISGANSATYTATSAGSYTVVISNSSNTNCSTESAATVVNFIQLTASAILSDSSVCYGSSAQLNSRVNPGSNNGSYTNNTSASIPDNNSNGTSSTISAAGLPSSLAGLTIRLTANVTHQYNGDVELYLVRPGGSLGAGTSGTNFRSPVAGQSILLSSDNGGSGQNYTGVIFSDAAATLISSVTGNQNITGEFRPEQLFSTLTGNPNGTWTLIAVDDASTDVGTLTSWTIEFSYSSGLTYSWTSIPSGFTSSIANPGAVSPTQTTTYIVNATETASGCSVTDSVTLTINGTVVPTASVTPSGAQNICPPQTSLTLTASSSISSPTYQWYKNGSIIPGETGLTYTVTSGGSYYVVASGIPTGECVATSNEVPAFYHSTPAIQATNDTMICVGGTAQLTATGTISETQQFTQGSPLDIPDNITPVESNLSVSNLPASLAGVTISVAVNSTHAYNTDQEFYLVRPGGSYSNVVNGTNRLTTTTGQSIVLSTDNGGTGDNYDVIFTDSASVLVSSLSASNVTVNGYKRPEQLLSTLTGNPNGTWKLVAVDDENIDAGVLNSWTLTFTFSNGLSYSWTSLPAGFTSNVQNPGAVNPTTTTTYIVTATDQLYGCSASDTMKVYIDTIPPVTQCQNITIYLDANGAASITAADINNNSTDNCAIISLVAGQTSFTCANIGANSVSLTVTDASGNSSSCNATVTVLDTVSPVVNCQNITIYLDANGAASITAADINNNSTDNCAIISLVAGQTSFTCANIGAISVSLTATDASGNSSSCNAIVTVLDTVSPVANCQNISVYLDANGTASITAADINNNSSDNCAIISLTAGQTSFTCANIGANTVSLIATDASGNSSSCNATVTVLDTVSPVANCQNISVYLDANGTASITAADINNNSSDNCAIISLTAGQTSFTCANIGANTVSLTATDASGNSSSCNTIVTVLDTVSPVVNCQNITVYLDANGTTSITAADINNNSTDNCAIISLTAGQTSFTCANIGANTVSLIATDASGNSSSCNATVTVLDTVSPVANCQNISVYLDANGTASITAADINNNSTDNCAIISLTAGQTSFTCANIGANTVSLTASDASGNSSSCNAIVTVLDTVSPVANCQNATIIINETTGIALVTAAEINLNSSDNCSYTASVSPSTFDCTQIGNNTVILTIVDPSGNSASCQSTVTVTSNLAISGNIQDVNCYGESNGNIDITISGGSGNYTYLWSDNSTNEDLSNSSAGTYTVTVFDATGCSASVVFQISSPDSLHIDLTTTNVSCNGLNDGTATSIISGGTTPYTYFWDNDGEITPAISELYAGTYQLEVTDDNGCVKNANFEIFEPAPPIVDAGSDGEVCAESAFTLNGYIDGSTTAAVWSTSGDGVFGDINALQTTYTPGINDSLAGSVILVLTGNNLNGLCQSKSDTLILTVNGKPAPATTILGPRSVCRGNSGNFSIAPTSNTDTYVWSYISGQDITISPSIDNLSAIVAFGNTITNSGSYIFVQGINQCGIGAPRQLWVRHDIGNPQFATPAQAVVCPNTTGIIYRVRKVQGADSLTWTVPAGCTYVQLNDTTISTDFGPTYTSGDLIVTAHFSCGNTTLIRKITSGTSRVPGVISGPKNGLCDTTVVFSIAAVSGAASYNWTMPTGATIVGPANGTSVSVYFAPGFTKSSIAVAGVNACGVISNTRTLQVSEKPATPTTVSGPSAVCAGQQNIQYTVAAVTGANGYQWTIPSTATLVSGQGSNSIIVNWGSVTGSVNVKALRNCSGLSTAKTYPVSVNCRQAEIANNGISINNLYPNPNHGAFTLEIKSSVTTDAQFILTDVSGRIVLQIQENINEGITTYPMSFNAESGTYILKVITSTGVSDIRFFAE